MSESVQVLNWKIHNWIDSSVSLWDVCESIVDRMPFIRAMVLDFGFSKSVQSPLAFLLAQLEHLETIDLPLYGLPPEMICGLSGLPRLKEIGFMIGNSYTYTSGSDSLGLDDFQTSKLHLPPSAFPMLSGLSFSAPQLTAASVFLELSAFPLSGLTRLEIRVPFVAALSPASVFSILNMLSRSALSLTSLKLILTPCHSVSTTRILRVSPLRFNDLSAVGGFHCLRRFGIHHPYPLSFNEREYEEFARLLPSAEVLDLNPHPTVYQVPSVSIRVLDHFARICPDLKRLSVFLRGFTSTARAPRSQFGSALRELHFGRSPLPAVDNIVGQKTLARYLAILLPASTTVGHFAKQAYLDSRVFDITNDGRDLREVPEARQEIMKDRWWAIVVMARALREARERDSVVNSDLRSLVADLRSNVAVLRA